MKSALVSTLVLVSLLCLSITPAVAQKTVAVPNNPVSSQDIPEWQARLELADLLAGTGRFDEAEVQYKKVLDAQPDNEAARRGIARVLAWTGKGDEAARLFAKLPGDQLTADDRMLLADHHIGLREYSKAAEQLNAILAEDSNADNARLKLAEVLSWDGKLKESIDQYERLLKRRPDDIQIRRKYAQVLSWAGRNDDAIRELKHTLE